MSLRDSFTGALLLRLEAADISQLLSHGWRAPVRVMVKAADGRTDLHGLMFLPSKVDTDAVAAYPIINNA